MTITGDITNPTYGDLEDKADVEHRDDGLGIDDKVALGHEERLHVSEEQVGSPCWLWLTRRTAPSSARRTSTSS